MNTAYEIVNDGDVSMDLSIKYKKDFPILSQRTLDDRPLIYLDHAATSQKPRQVLEALNNYYSSSNANVHRGAHQLSSKATELFEESRKVTAEFGASTKGNAILQYFELTSEDIPFAVDRAPWKENLYTIGSWIPIKFEEDPTRFQADYYLVLPWGFIDEFILREEKFLDAGGKFIVPFPVPRIIDKSGETLL